MEEMAEFRDHVRAKQCVIKSHRAKVLEEAFMADFITLPPQSRSPHRADKTKYYRYHQNYGHTMEVFNRNIEEKKEANYRKDEVRDLGRLAEGSKRLRGVINTIADGFNEKKDASCHVHRPRFVGINSEQNEPMVITVEVTNFAVKKTLHFVQHPDQTTYTKCPRSHYINSPFGVKVSFINSTNSDYMSGSKDGSIVLCREFEGKHA
ncbi:hypothetical protein CR513_00120, partial [Mucuna pruriens]